MTSLFTTGDRNKILARIEKLQPDSPALWGKMNSRQMLKHCQTPLKVALGEMTLKQTFIGLLFGKMAKKSLLKAGPFAHNLPTAPEFKVRETHPVFEREKAELIALIQKFGEEGPQSQRGKHPFFGAMTEEEWDILQWKHLDHHLRQFGV